MWSSVLRSSGVSDGSRIARTLPTNFWRTSISWFSISTDLVRAAARSGKIPVRLLLCMARWMRSTSFWLDCRSRCRSPTSDARLIMRATSGSALTHFEAAGGTKTEMSNFSRLRPTRLSK